MGFFSWKTSDTKRSITNNSSGIGTFKVTMILPDNSRVTEDDYEGYGIFGGKDFYAEVAKFNRPEECCGEIEVDRSLGIEIAFGEIRTKPKLPKFVENDRGQKWEDLPNSEDCEFQGYFYPEDEDEDYYDEY